MKVPVWLISAPTKVVNWNTRTFRWGGRRTMIFLQPHRPYRKVFADQQKAEQIRNWFERNHPSRELDEAWMEFLSELKNLGGIK